MRTVFLFLVSMTVFASTAPVQAQSEDVSHLPRELGPFRLGMSIDSAYSLLQFSTKRPRSCYYSAGEPASCTFYEVAHFPISFLPADTVRFTVDRATGQILSVRADVGKADNEGTTFAAVRDSLRQYWGRPSDSSASCLKWGSWLKGGLICSRDDRAFYVVLRAPRSYEETAVAGDEEMDSSIMLHWWPRWDPFYFRSARPGQYATEVIEALGLPPTEGRCEPEDSRDESIHNRPIQECTWSAPELTFQGLSAATVEIEVDEVTERVRGFSVEFGPMPRDSAQAARDRVAPVVSEMWNAKVDQLGSVMLARGPFLPRFSIHCIDDCSSGIYVVDLSIDALTAGFERDERWRLREDELYRQ